MLWMILTLMTVVAAVGLAIPLIRRRDAGRAERNDAVGVLKAQLGELEAQAQAGASAGPEAEALKSDLKRRVLAEGRKPEAAPRPLSERTLLIVALTLVVTVTLAGTGLYLAMGWVVLAALAPLIDRMPAAGLAWLLAGGLSYTLGAVVFSFDSRWRYAHALWHLFVLGGSACHFIAVLHYAS